MPNEITQADIWTADQFAQSWDADPHRTVKRLIATLAAHRIAHEAPLLEALAATRKAERDKIVAWMRGQAGVGAGFGNNAEKGTTKRAAFGGGSLALARAAAAIEKGEHHD